MHQAAQWFRTATRHVFIVHDPAMTINTQHKKITLKDKNKEHHVAGYLTLSPGSSMYKLCTTYTVHKEEPGNEAT